jgi:hypothetical protein
MSATVGAVVVVFILFAFQQLARLYPTNRALETTFTALRERTRLRMLLVVGSISMAALLASPILVAFGLAVDLVDSHIMTLAAIGLFTFSITSIAFALAAYLYLERPFVYPDAEPAQV